MITSKRRITLRATLGGLWCGVLILSAVPDGRAQSARLNGFVTDQSDGQPLESANVVLHSQGQVVRGTTTNQDGLYLLPGLNPGRYIFQVSFIGYQTHTDTLDLALAEVRTLNVALVPEQAQLGEVLVETERTEGVALVTAGQQTIRPTDLDRVPAPDLSGDLTSYLTTLPGVVTTGDQGGQLFIRGGEPSQNLVLLDGILLYQPFHVLGFYSAFPSDILNRVDVYAGGFGSQFGGRLSSVIDIATRNGNARSFAGAASLSPFVGSVRVEGPVVRNRLSLLASVRQSVIEEGAAQYVDRPLPFSFSDVFAKLYGVITRNSRASITALRTHDQGTLVEDTGGAPPEEIRWKNEAVGLRLLILPRIVSILADLHVSFSRLTSELGSPEAPTRTSSIENTYVALEATYLGDRVDTWAGSTLRVSELTSELGGLFQNVESRNVGVTNWGSYLEFDFDVGRGLHVRPGLRAQFYRVRFEPFLEPRLRVVWERGLHQVSGAAGLYHQEIIGLSDRRDAASVFTVWTNIPKPQPGRETIGNGRPQRAVHAVLGYRVSPAAWLDVSIEGFYKRLSNLFVAEWTAFPRFTTRLQPASGRSLGVEARLEVRRGAFYGYVTYGLSSTRYQAEQAAIQIWYGVETLDFRPPHDRRHQVNALASTTLYGFDVSVRWQFGSGLPFSRAEGFDGFALVDEIRSAFDTPSFRRVIYERPFNATLPTYHRLDVSVDRTFSLGRAAVTVQGSLINAYDRRNLFYLDVFTLRRVDQLPLVPSFGLKVEFR